MLQEQREFDNIGLGRPLKCSSAYWNALKAKEKGSEFDGFIEVCLSYKCMRQRRSNIYVKHVAETE